MKKHDFNSAIEIFKAIFEGWVVVTKNGKKHQMTGVDLVDAAIALDGYGYEDSSEISHLEQTKPTNGDEVWAWNDTGHKRKGDYIGKYKGKHAVSNWLWDTINLYQHVELAKEPLKLTIEEATELLRKGEKVEKPFEIIKQ